MLYLNPMYTSERPQQTSRKRTRRREDEEDGNNWLVGQSELEEVEMDDSLDLAGHRLGEK